MAQFDFNEFLQLLDEQEDVHDAQDDSGLRVVLELDEPAKPAAEKGDLGKSIFEDEGDELAIELTDDVLSEPEDISLSLTLLDLPTGMFEDEEEEDEEANVEESGPKSWEKDEAHSDFIRYITDKVKNIPAHSGQTTVGCEKAISYLKRLNREISKAIQSDSNDEIDEISMEGVRDTIYNFIEKLEDAFDFLQQKKRKRKSASFRLGRKIVARLDGETDVFYASVAGDDMEEMLVPVEIIEPSDVQMETYASAYKDGKLVKEAGVISTFMDPFLEAITRLLMRSHISQGKDMRDVYGQLDKQYKFTDRERLSIHEVLHQAGIDGTGIYTDLGRLNEKDINVYDGKNVEFSTVYPG